jgi:hypothetical protein
MEWIRLAQNRHQRRAFVNRIMGFGFTESGRFLDHSRHCRFFGKAVLRGVSE